MRVRPQRLNTTIGVLFAVGSACFMLGTVPTYVSAVGTLADAATFFVGSIFFTSAAACQLTQSQTPDMAPGALASGASAPLKWWNPLPADAGWRAAAVQFVGTLAFNVSTGFAVNTSLSVKQVDRLVWTPDFVGSILFLIASWYGIIAVSGRIRAWAPHDTFWVIAWANMVGSIFFMMSALGAYLIPATGDMIDPRWANAGTFLGAVCFFLGAVLLLPAWRKATSGPT